MLDVVRNRSITVEVADVIGRNADVIEIDTGALGQVTRSIGEEADTCTALFELGARSLIDGHVEARISKQQRAGQATERTANDGDSTVGYHSRSGVTVCRR